jgi:hypothetical protein
MGEWKKGVKDTKGIKEWEKGDKGRRHKRTPFAVEFQQAYCTGM